MKLLLTGPEGEKHERPLTEAPLVVGRGLDCDFVIDDRTVSRHHCRLRMAAQDQVLLEDLDSRYGTTINGERIDSQVAVLVGDRIGIGEFTGSVLPDGAEGDDIELATCPTTEMEATRTELPAATRKVRLLSPEKKSASLSPAQLVLLVALGLLGTLLVVYILLDLQ